MIISGITRGELRGDSSKHVLAAIGDYSKTLVARADIEKFARARNVFPTFLFDTLAPINAAANAYVAHPENKSSSADPAPLPQRPNRGGRPQEHDWDTFIAEIVRRANLPDGLPETQAELVRAMLAWFQNTYGREPAESAVKSRISKIYRYLAEAKNLDG